MLPQVLIPRCERKNANSPSTNRINRHQTYGKFRARKLLLTAFFSPFFSVLFSLFLHYNRDASRNFRNGGQLVARKVKRPFRAVQIVFARRHVVTASSRLDFSEFIFRPVRFPSPSREERAQKGLSVRRQLKERHSGIKRVIIRRVLSRPSSPRRTKIL